MCFANKGSVNKLTKLVTQPVLEEMKNFGYKLSVLFAD